MKLRNPSTVTADIYPSNSEGPVLGRLGSMETRFARCDREIRAAQALRYQVFYEEQGAKADKGTRLNKRDEDHLDFHCDHLLVLDRDLPDHQQIVGTYRLIDDVAAQTADGFYSQSEFDLTPLLGISSNKRHLEVGRSCIAPAYRSRRTIELMWQGIWATVLERKIDVIFGCASFVGTNPDDHHNAFAWLYENALVGRDMNCPAVAENHFPLPEPDTGPDGQAVSSKRTFASLPPLLKGYLRLGAKVATDAVIDHRFGTIDVLVVLDVAQISKKYIAHYRADASRFAA